MMNVLVEICCQNLDFYDLTLLGHLALSLLYQPTRHIVTVSIHKCIMVGVLKTLDEKISFVFIIKLLQLKGFFAKPCVSKSDSM